MEELHRIYEHAENVHCSPKAHKYAEKDRTCFSHGELKLLAKEFNNKAQPHQPKITGKSKKELAHKLLKAYEAICNKQQYCWIKQLVTDPEKLSKLEKSFRPPKPPSWEKDRDTWLNTYDILYVMNQYEDLYKDYSFLGVFPIDFAENDSYGRCVGEMMCTFDVRTTILNRGKKRFGVVFNTDPSSAGGSHWISLYCSLDTRKGNRNFGIYFYDSVANPAPKEVKAFMKKVVKQVDQLKTDGHPGFEKRVFESRVNEVQKQYGNNECGMYSVVYQTQMLKNVRFDTVCKRMKNDSYLNKLRDVLYRPNH